MNRNILDLLHLYKLRSISKYKANLFTEKHCEIPAELREHIVNIEAEILEKENACKQPWTQSHNPEH